ncbi:hypothetical protein ACMAZE_00060 [Pseudopelagicola sp. nBUS_20]|uniref:hypothetical protein n=1 Tax=Pseudopelagicola sp. nBUS_20 TaxID=3395317 RepID=UPI003EC0420F
MFGTKSRSLRAPVTESTNTELPYWTVWRISLWSFVFVWGALAINFYFIGLMWQVINLPVIAPVTAIQIAFPFSFPMTWVSARWVRRLMDEAES